MHWTFLPCDTNLKINLASQSMVMPRHLKLNRPAESYAHLPTVVLCFLSYQLTIHSPSHCMISTGNLTRLTEQVQKCVTIFYHQKHFLLS